MHEALLWEREGDRIRCGLCPNLCLIAEGATGTCGVRRNDEGTLMALTYGLVSSVATDPIEKKPVFHYFPGSPVLSFGSVGCSMRCGHCQNWQISRSDPSKEGVELRDLSPSDAVDMAKKYRCPGIAFTYNEPVIWAEYVTDVAEICRREDIFTIMVTNGYVTTEGMDLFGPLIDVWRVDLKGATDETYKQLCGVRSVEPVKAAAVRAKHHWGMHVEVVTNIVPTVNDSDEELRSMAEWIAREIGEDTPWHVTRFIPYLEYSHLSPTPVETLHRAREIGHEAGLHHVYLGNIDDIGGEDTISPSCDTVDIQRTGYSIVGNDPKNGLCARCGADLNITDREGSTG